MWQKQQYKIWGPKVDNIGEASIPRSTPSKPMNCFQQSFRSTARSTARLSVFVYCTLIFKHCDKPFKITIEYTCIVFQREEQRQEVGGFLTVQ